LRDAFPAARIDWLVQESFAECIASHPALNRAIPFPRKDFSRWIRSLNISALRAFLRPLREAQYDLVLDCQGLARSALFAISTRARTRIGHADARELAWLAYTLRVPASIESHTVDRMLSLVEAIGIPARRDSASMKLFVPHTARGFALSQRLTPATVVLAPTSRWPGKQWPDRHFAQLVFRLTSRGLHCAIVGAASERDQIPRVLEAAKSAGSSDLVGLTSLGQLMDVIAHSACVVANDSAALHIAVGFQRPIVALFGPTRVKRVGPYGHQEDVLQHVNASDIMDHKNATAGASLMNRIKVDQVEAAVLARLEAGPATNCPY
jgi:lipopolysaccharide heptosyltransferase I